MTTGQFTCDGMRPNGRWKNMATKMRQLRDKDRIEAFLRRAPELHIYSLGDLDDFFWPYTTWYGWEEAGELRDVVLLYAGKALPTVVGISEEPDVVSELLRELSALLPARFHAHLSPGVEDVFRDSHKIRPHGTHYRMALRDRSPVQQVDCSPVIRLTQPHLDELLEFYEESYPGNWFDARMLQTGQYFGLRETGRLVSVAGVHVYSQPYKVAAIGNVATAPAWRNRGCGTLVMARLCQSLLEKAEHIGLNVKADNTIAIACYRKLGFEIVAPYGEFNIERRM